MRKPCISPQHPLQAQILRCTRVSSVVKTTAACFPPPTPDGAGLCTGVGHATADDHRRGMSNDDQRDPAHNIVLGNRAGHQEEATYELHIVAQLGLARICKTPDYNCAKTSGLLPHTLNGLFSDGASGYLRPTDHKDEIGWEHSPADQDALQTARSA